MKISGSHQFLKLKPVEPCFALWISPPLCGGNSGCFAEFEMVALELSLLDQYKRNLNCYAFSDMVIWDSFPYLEKHFFFTERLHNLVEIFESILI